MPFDSTGYSTGVDITSRKARLEHLITVLQRVPDSQFDLGVWSCGTSACAAGWAGKDEIFIAQGFQTHHAANDVCYVDPLTKLLNLGLLACCEFFHLSHTEAKFLFLTTYYGQGHITTNEVIRHVQRLLDGEIVYAL